ncbi:MAG: PAS-family sensor histidine kinase [Phenylobacterium sp.]|nr:PAS-family sensor histidine kinase [Phenylobacterium sp.]
MSAADASALRNDVRRLEQILEGYGDGFCTFDYGWKITYCNHAAELYAGMTRDQAVGRVYWEAVPSAVGSAFEAALRQAMVDRISVELEVPSSIRPGSAVAIRAFPIEDGLGISFGDITERRQRQERDRDQAQRLELALAASGLGDWSWNPATDVVTLSDRAAGIFGIPPGPLMTWSQILTRVNPDDLVIARRAVERAFAGRVAYEIEYRLTPPGRDDEIWVMSRAQAEYGADGRPLGLQGVVGDITRRKAQEAELRESEARFRVMADSAPAPVWMTTAAGPIEFVNRAFAEFAGKPTEQLVGDIWAELLHPDDLLEVATTRFKAAEGPHPYWVEARVRHASGEWRWMRTSSRPRFDAAGKFEGYVGIGMDMTEVRAAEERQQLLINELNHRVKNTLATVQSIAHQTLRDGAVTRVARAQFTERLLALSNAHNVLTRANWEGAELAHVAAEAVRPYDEAVTPRIHMEGPVVRLTPSAALALSMAFHELATNATKYGALSTPAGRVALGWSVRPDGRAVEIVWREAGGPAVATPTGKGFGSRLLGQGLAAELGQPAALTYDRKGLVCAITAPVAED